jgi:hypothetical protein
MPLRLWPNLGEQRRADRLCLSLPAEGASMSARELLFQPYDEPDSLGRRHWVLTWLDGEGKERGQQWHGTEADLRAMAERVGCRPIDTTPPIAPETP